MLYSTTAIWFWLLVFLFSVLHSSSAFCSFSRNCFYCLWRRNLGLTTFYHQLYLASSFFLDAQGIQLADVIYSVLVCTRGVCSQSICFITTKRFTLILYFDLYEYSIKSPLIFSSLFPTSKLCSYFKLWLLKVMVVICVGYLRLFA